MILVDSSVWIDHLNDDVTRAVALLRRLIQRGDALIGVGDLILCEVLQCLDTDREAAAVETALRQFPILEILNDHIAVRAAANYRALRAKGVTIRTTIDLLIGTFCIERNCQLLHNDRDLEPMVRHLGLRVL